MSLRDVFRWGPDPEVKAYVADLNSVAYSSYTNQRMWIRTGNVVLALIIWSVLTDHVSRLEALTGFLGVWCGFLTGKSGVTALSRYGKSKTSAKLVEAQERGKATAMEQAKPQTVVHAEDQSHVKVDATAEHPKQRLHPEPSGLSEEQQWAAGDPRAGIL